MPVDEVRLYGDPDRVRGRSRRLARFGAGWLRRLLAVHGATVEVLHPKAQGGQEELPEEFISLVIAFAGRLHGMWSAAVRRWLLAASDRCPPGGGR